MEIFELFILVFTPLPLASQKTLITRLQLFDLVVRYGWTAANALLPATNPPGFGEQIEPAALAIAQQQVMAQQQQRLIYASSSAPPRIFVPLRTGETSLGIATINLNPKP